MNTKRDLPSIVELLEPSLEQAAPIQARGKDIVVTAGAGTGKTRTLVARYLDLLAEGVPLRSLVAITFTKKAAREMRNRVREEVRKYLLVDDLPEGDQNFWREIYQGLDAARISTIHSLAGDILRQHPAEMGLDPEFEQLEEATASRMKAQAIEAAFNWASEDEQTSGLFPVFGAWKLRRVLSELLNKRLDVSRALDRLPDDLWSHWEPYLIEELRAFVEDPLVSSGLDGLASLKYDGTMERAQEAGDLLVDDLRIVIESWEVIQDALRQEDWIQVSRSIGSLGNHLKQKGKGENWAPAKPREVIREIQNIFNVQIGKVELDLAVDKRLAMEIIPALRSLFRFADQWYAVARDQINGLDFDDLEDKVLHLLKNNPSVLGYWQQKIQSLLVDEYQDTNARQRELINLLNAGNNCLFIVGDGKQSIYRFRGADVAVFRQEQERIGREGEYFHLDTSYRSHPRLLNALNFMLAPVLGDRTDLPYLEPFAALQAGRVKPPVLDLPAYVEVHLTIGNKSAGAGSKAAEAVATRLLEMMGDKSNSGAGQQLNYGDVAVLCRASSSFPAFEQAFERAGIPYTTVAGQGFYERPEVRDVLNALQVFSDPQNDLALAGLMRSPVVGFPDKFLLDLRDFQRSEKSGSLMGAARKFSGRLEGDLKIELNSFILMIEEFSALADRVTAAEMISHFLDKTAYAAGMALAGQERSVGNLRKLVADAQATGIVNLTDFLNAIQEIRSVAIREGEAQFVSEGAVQIMTVHQAKGLEFPIVILGDATKRERAIRDILIDDFFGIIPPFNMQRVVEDIPGIPSIGFGKSFAYEIALARERLKEEAETNRLLYVAATRAQDLLIISGAMGNPTRDDKLPNLAGWMGKLAGPLDLEDCDLELNRDGSSVHHIQIENTNLSAEVVIYESLVKFDFIPVADEEDHDQIKALKDPALWNQLDNHIGKVASTAPVLQQIYPASKVGNTSRAPSRIVGEIVHRALERWKFPAGGETDFINWAETEFRTKGIYDQEAINSGYRRARQILERFTATDLYQRMDQAEVLLHEVFFSLPGEKESGVTGLIDALFMEDNQWVLVEFKTDEIKTGAEIDWNSVDYLQQVGGYLDAVERLLEQRPAPILCFLDYGGRVKLVTDRW